jgi:hypothetical protein
LEYYSILTFTVEMCTYVWIIYCKPTYDYWSQCMNLFMWICNTTAKQVLPYYESYFSMWFISHSIYVLLHSPLLLLICIPLSSWKDLMTQSDLGHTSHATWILSSFLLP